MEAVQQQSPLDALSNSDRASRLPSAMLSLPPLLDIDNDVEDDNDVETESEQHKTKKDWPYRDVFPQFLRERSDEREGNLSAIMSHMKQIQRDESKIKVLNEEKKKIGLVKIQVKSRI